MVVEDKTFAFLSLTVNGETRDRMFPDAYHHQDRATSVAITVAQLEKGDTVKIEKAVPIPDWDKYVNGELESNNLSRCSFSGYKVA